MQMRPSKVSTLVKKNRSYLMEVKPKLISCQRIFVGRSREREMSLKNLNKKKIPNIKGQNNFFE